ncbi:MAG: 3,4-dihydroxy-2-butanone-4-phosphate synthase [Candidatus Thermoplasmatota archaeon]
MMTSRLQHALNDLRHGKFVLVYDYDDRETETDFVKAAQFITPQDIQIMRQDGGGLIFLMISYTIAQQLQLPFLADVYASLEDSYPVFKALKPTDIPYDTKSSFSLYINHRKTFTGITDNDRSLTIKKFSELAEKINTLGCREALEEFGKEFRSPGHVPICIGSQNLLQERRGHTELVVALLQMAGIVPVGTGCEIMGDSGHALSKRDAQRYAQKHGLLFLEGSEIIEAWKQWSR